jgi:hypothetical protein
MRSLPKDLRVQLKLALKINYPYNKGWRFRFIIYGYALRIYIKQSPLIFSEEGYILLKENKLSFNISTYNADVIENIFNICDSVFQNYLTINSFSGDYPIYLIAGTSIKEPMVIYGTIQDKILLL